MNQPEAVAARTRAFVEEHVLPIDDEYDGDVDAAGGDGLREEIAGQRRARPVACGLSTSPLDCGGLGLGMVDRVPSLRGGRATRSLVRWRLNIASPDQGNVHLLDKVATRAQRKRFLEPLARGDGPVRVRDDGAPAGAGSDPSALRTEGDQGGDEWVINGRKWLITGAEGAGFFIVMARTSGEPEEPGGARCSSCRGRPRGSRLVATRNGRRSMPAAIARSRSPMLESRQAVLGGVDEGFRYAQVRLAPARITHCMRWTGAARRAHEVAGDTRLRRRSGQAAQTSE